MQQLVEMAINAHEAYELYLTQEANRMTEIIKATAEALKRAKIPGGFLYDETVELDICIPPGESLPRAGVGWDGERLVHYYSETHPSWDLASMPNLLGEKREIRIESKRLLEGLLNDIAKHYHERTP